MNNISKEISTISNFGNIKHKLHQYPSSNQKHNRITNSEKSAYSNLNNLSELAKKVQYSDSDIREDAINRAHSLLNDRDWLSDKNLDSLASKITQLEKF